jgi:hypothetical protein
MGNFYLDIHIFPCFLHILLSVLTLHPRPPHFLAENAMLHACMGIMTNETIYVAAKPVSNPLLWV